MYKVKIAYFSLFFSMIIFLIYIVLERFNFGFINYLFFLSLVSVIISIIFFRVIINKSIESKLFEEKNIKFDKVLEVGYEDLSIKTTNLVMEQEDDFDNINFKRIDLLFNSNNNEKYLKKSLKRCSIVYNLPNKVENYFSRAINMDLKTLEIKLYLQKRVRIYIDSSSGDYLFDLEFLKK